MKPIEPGCLAIIVQASNTINIGRTVTVEKQVVPGEVIPFIETPAGSVYGTANKSGWLVSSQEYLISTIGQRSNKAVFETKQLMRIGDDRVQDVLKKVVENVE